MQSGSELVAKPDSGRLRLQLAGACLLSCLLVSLESDAEPIVTEFMARNAGTLGDGHGNYPDWIEISNPSSQSINLEGWYLTDDPDRPTRWRIPELWMQPNARVVLFASGLDELDPAGRLHTNFRLAGDGEYLALVHPDGQTIANAFGSGEQNYPQQRTDVSYGTVTELRRSTLVAEKALARAAVPQNDRWGLAWTGGNEPFDDADWLSGTAGVGFDTRVVAGQPSTPLAYWRFDSLVDGRAPDEMGNYHASVSGAVLTEQGGGRFGAALRFDGQNDYATAGVIPNLVAPPALTVSLWFKREADHNGQGNDTDHAVNNVLLAHSSYASNDNFEVGTERGKIELYLDTRKRDGEARHAAEIRNGVWYHLVVSYDRQASHEAKLYLDGALLDRYKDWGGRFSDSGISPLTFGIANVDYQRFGDFEGLIDDAAVWDRVLSPAQIKALAEGVSPVDLAGLSPMIGLKVGGQMPQRNASVYTRFPFTVEDPGAFERLTLGMSFDAGFVAYLNGAEIARRNVPGSITWNSVASREQDVRQVSTGEAVDVSAHLNKLRAGDNILAVHGLNARANDDDFLIAPTLIGTQILERGQAYFPRATPGAANRRGVLGFVSDVGIDITRGFFESPFEVTLSTGTPGARIIFTIDGKAPTEETGTRYEAPITITTTTVLRAAAFKDDLLPSRVNTQTYLFLDDVIRQPTDPAHFPDTWHTQDADYEMDPEIVDDPRYQGVIKDALRTHPTISVAIDVDHLLDREIGIYANSRAEGELWERPVSVELFDFPHGKQLQVDAGLRIQGHISRRFNRPKHNLRLSFRRKYGPGMLKFRLYDDSPADRFDNVILRGQNADSWIHPNANHQRRAQYIRDQWHRDVQRAMGHRTINQGHAHLYINGLYWGFYHILDRFESEFMAENFGGSEHDYDVVQDFNRRPGLVEAKAGDLDAWNAMMAIAHGDIESPRAFAEIHKYLDVESFVDYLLLNFYSGNQDWDKSNWRSGRERQAGAGFKFFAWDSERTIGDSRHSTVVTDIDILDKNVANRPSSLHQRLISNPEYRLFFADRAHKHLFNGGALAPENAAALWMQRVKEIRLALVAESARWGDAHRPDNPYSPEEEWIAEVNRLQKEFFPVRGEIVLEQLRRRGLYPSLAAPSFSFFGGDVSSGHLLTMSAPAGRIFYTTDGADPRLPGGAVNPAAIEGNLLVLLQSVRLKARVKQDQQWSAVSEATFSVTPAGDTEAATSGRQVEEVASSSGTNAAVVMRYQRR